MVPSEELNVMAEGLKLPAQCSTILLVAYEPQFASADLVAM